MWTPTDIVIHTDVENDPVTLNILDRCPDANIFRTGSGKPNDIKKLIPGFSESPKILSQILAGKSVVYVAPVGPGDVDEFHMPDPRMNCPAFPRIKHASNGCYYRCEWCYLKLTYRASRPYITIKAQHDKLIQLADKHVNKAGHPVILNCGELADALALEHLSMFARDFIPWAGQSKNGFLFMLTKSDDVSQILDLNHNGHTVLAWSLNEPSVSRSFEIGAPTFERRLEAAHLAQAAGYPIRIRIDPIVPFEGWQNAYAKAVRDIFQQISPERVTLGTLRFEKGFYGQRNNLFQKTEQIMSYMDRMGPMFERMSITVDEKSGETKTSQGKYSFPEQERIAIFNFIIQEVYRYSSVPIALCKESNSVWEAVGLDPTDNQCVCQL